MNWEINLPILEVEVPSWTCQWYIP
jgi:hypothetical protein